MINPNSNNARSNTEPELTLGDVIVFIIKAKWFSLAGIVIGTVVASIYLAITPAVYQSSVTVQINVDNSANSSMGATEILERLALGTSITEILSIMQPVPSASALVAMENSIKSATVSKTSNFITFNIKANSAVDSQKLSVKLANAAITLAEQLNAANIANLQKNLTLKKAFLASLNSTKDAFPLQLSILDTEIQLNSQSNSKSIIVNGPTINSSPISPKPIPILSLGSLLGLCLGLLLFFIKRQFQNN